jgi:MFS superfamily sulfate permease-like transporter
MMFLVGIELTKFARELKPGRDLIPMAATLIAAVVFNMAAGFAVGMIVHYGVFGKRKPLTD